MRQVRMLPVWVLGVLSVASFSTTVHATIVAELFTDRTALEMRLGGTIQVADFDDVDTSTTDPAAFAADRYAATKGIVITAHPLAAPARGHLHVSSRTASAAEPARRHCRTSTSAHTPACRA